MLAGRVLLPGDKSISHRALLLAGLANGESTLHGVADSGDCRAMVSALRAVGVDLAEIDPGSWRVRSPGAARWSAPEGPIDLGNSGTAMRLLCGALAPCPFPAVLSGDESLSARPMERVAAPLRAMGADLSTTDGHAPVRIAPAQAPLRGILHPEPVVSAQVKSALLLAGLRAQGRTCVREARPSRDHTERMLPTFGARCEREDDRVCIPGGQELTPGMLTVPRDLSAAAFFIVGALIAPGSRVLLPGVGINPRRDGVLRILRAMGADIRQTPADAVGDEPVADLEVHAQPLTGVSVPAELVPDAIDEFPVLCIAAACARGVTRFEGIGELRVKESDRIAAMQEGLTRLGIDCSSTADSLRIEGGTLAGGTVHSHSDHRIAMSFAMAALAATGPVEIEEPAWVDSSYPGFADTARQAGLGISDA